MSKKTDMTIYRLKHPLEDKTKNNLSKGKDPISPKTPMLSLVPRKLMLVFLKIKSLKKKKKKKNPTIVLRNFYCILVLFLF